MQSDFTDFLSEIEPSSSTVDYISSIQTNLRDYLKNHSSYKDVYLDSFLSGSYAKHTAIRPASGDKKRDVDIIVVTSYKSTKNSAEVLTELNNILLEKSDYAKASMQHHSIGIEMSNVSIDVVPVIVDEYDDSLFYICDSTTGAWTKTDPKGHKLWSTNTNKDNNKKYKPIVKIFKWWRRKHCSDGKKFPKGITLEKIVADNLGDSSLTIESLLIETMQNIIARYKDAYVSNGINPVINDPSDKISGNDLLSGYTSTDFSSFITKLEEHTALLNADGTTNDTWREILGNEFPQGNEDAKALALSNLQKCISAPHRIAPPWPRQRGGVAFILVDVVMPSGNSIEYSNNGEPLDKRCTLHFRVATGVKEPYTVKWQIVNTGEEARNACALRGTFDNANEYNHGRKESTLYSGSHSVQCFILKKGICVAQSKEFIINIK